MHLPEKQIPRGNVHAEEWVGVFCSAQHSQFWSTFFQCSASSFNEPLDKYYSNDSYKHNFGKQKFIKTLKTLILFSLKLED